MRREFEVLFAARFRDGMGAPVRAGVPRVRLDPMGWDGMQIFLTEHTGDCQFGGLVHFDIPDVDGYYRELLDRGVAVGQAPENSLGSHLRDMVVVDPDGNRLCFLTRSADRMRE